MRILRNLRIAAAASLRNLGDDPARFVLLVSQRFPKSVGRRLAALVGRFGRVGKVYSAWMRGQREDAAAQLRALPPLRTGLSRHWAAALAVAGDVPLEEVPGLKRVSAVTRARAARKRGALSEAIDVLRGQRGGGAARLRRVLESERELLQSGIWLGAGAARSTVSHAGGPLRVLHVLTNSLPHTQSGYTLRSHSILTEQVRGGIVVDAVTRVGYPVTVGKFAARDCDVVDGIAYHRVVPPRFPTTPRERLEAQVAATSRLCGAQRPSLLHTTTPYTNALVTQAVAAGCGLPWVYEVRGMPEKTWAAARTTDSARDEALSSELYELWRQREADVAAAADAVVTLSATMRDDLVARGVDRERIVIVPNAIDERLLTVDSVPAEVRTELGLPADGFWVGAVSSLVDYEGHDLVVDAVTELRERGLDVRLLLVGDGVARPELLRRAEPLGEFAVLPGRVDAALAKRYVEALDAVIVARRDRDVTRFVMPLKPIEAMAVGRPVVLSQLPVLEELNAAGECALAVEPESAAAIAAAVERLHNNAELRTGLVARGRKLAATRSWAAAVDTYLQTYKSLEVSDVTKL